MIRVFIWNPGAIHHGRLVPGHASLWLQGASRQEYISFWPGKSSGYLHQCGERLIDNHMADTEVFGPNPLSLVVPDDSKGQPGLNIARMFQAWDAIQRSAPDVVSRYQCARVVLRLLCEGGGTDFVGAGDSLATDLRDWWGTNVIYAWGAEDVKDYASRLCRGIAIARKRPALSQSPHRRRKAA